MKFYTVFLFFEGKSVCFIVIRKQKIDGSPEISAKVLFFGFFIILTTELLLNLCHGMEEFTLIGATVLVNKSFDPYLFTDGEFDNRSSAKLLPEIIGQKYPSHCKRFIFNPDSFCGIQLQRFLK